ncbi:MAG: tetratricopeptide repeat protein, partial [Deltaproteobacteria bacterium]|nr:tetratricopeptide repeat protein [Deltaproteobacteria bacterium]
MFKKIIALLVIGLCANGCAGKKNILPSEQAVYHNNRGISYLNEQDVEKAIFEFKTAIELAPDYAEPYNNLGVIYKIKGEFDTAVHYLQQAIAKDKKYASPHNHLAAVYLA